ncbi:hypothetical protein ACXNZO_006471, partial [Pseudomonas aeruginosa]
MYRYLRARAARAAYSQLQRSRYCSSIVLPHQLLFIIGSQKLCVGYGADLFKSLDVFIIAEAKLESLQTIAYCILMLPPIECVLWRYLHGSKALIAAVARSPCIPRPS